MQICESFEISFFDKDHQFIKTKRDNTKQVDNGVKLTVFLALHEDKYSDYGTITIDKKEYPIENGCLLIAKSRLVSYSVKASRPCFVVIMKVGGPLMDY